MARLQATRAWDESAVARRLEFLNECAEMPENSQQISRSHAWTQAAELALATDKTKDGRYYLDSALNSLTDLPSAERMPAPCLVLALLRHNALDDMGPVRDGPSGFTRELARELG